MIDARALLAAVRDALRADPALAAELRDALGARAADEWLDDARLRAEYGLRVRVVTEAAARGEITIGRRGRTPIVRRADLDRWLAQRGAPKRTAADAQAATEYEALLARRGGR